MHRTSLNQSLKKNICFTNDAEASCRNSYQWQIHQFPFRDLFHEYNGSVNLMSVGLPWSFLNHCDSHTPHSKSHVHPPVAASHRVSNRASPGPSRSHPSRGFKPLQETAGFSGCTLFSVFAPRGPQVHRFQPLSPGRGVRVAQGRAEEGQELAGLKERSAVQRRIR